MNEHAINSVEKRYDAFISYSHAADSRLAPQLQKALRRLAKPWYRLRGMRVFRDETDLSAAPEGWTLIQTALADSRYFLFMASREAAMSKWVTREIDYWFANRSSAEFLIVLTDGKIVWNDDRADFDWSLTNALPKALADKFKREPFWVDLRWAVTQQDLNFRHPQFLTAVARLAAPIRGLEVDALISEDRRQHKRNLWMAGIAAATTIMLGGIAFWQFQAKLAATERERDQRVLASVAGAYRVLYLDPLQAADQAHRALEIKRTPEAEEALNTALKVAQYRRENRAEEAQLTGAGAGYLMERWREGGVFSKLRRDGRYALVASERGKDGPNPPGTVYLIRLDTLRTKELSPGTQARGRRLEYMGFSTSGEEIFVARQFYLDIYDTQGDLTKSVQLEYHAKPTHLIAGMFGSYVLVGDTVGHIMLADTESPNRPQLKGGRHRDAALLVESNKKGTRAIVVFESGRADLIVLDDLKSPAQYEVATANVTFAAFSESATSGRFLTATKDGKVDLWDFADVKPKRRASLSHSVTSVGIAGFSKDDERVMSLGNDGTFRLWDVITGRLIASKP